MTAEVIKFGRNGSPQVLCQNLMDISDDIEFMLVVRVMKDREIGTDWTEIKNSLEAIGAVACLNQTVMEWYE